jgi:hypothetical protein
LCSSPPTDTTHNEQTRAWHRASTTTAPTPGPSSDARCGTTGAHHGHRSNQGDRPDGPARRLGCPRNPRQHTETEVKPVCRPRPAARAKPSSPGVNTIRRNAMGEWISTVAAASDAPAWLPSYARIPCQLLVAKERGERTRHAPLVDEVRHKDPSLRFRCGQDCQHGRCQGIRDPPITGRRRMKGVRAHRARVVDELPTDDPAHVDQAHRRALRGSMPLRGPHQPAVAVHRTPQGGGAGPASHGTPAGSTSPQGHPGPRGHQGVHPSDAQGVRAGSGW